MWAMFTHRITRAKKSCEYQSKFALHTTQKRSTSNASKFVLSSQDNIFKAMGSTVMLVFTY